MNHKAIGKVGFILLFFWTKNIIAQYKVEKLGPQINSIQYDEISPVVSRDGRTLYFTRIGTPEFNRTLIQEEVDLSKTLNETDYFQTLKSVYTQIAERDIVDPIHSAINQDIWIADSKEGLFDRVFHPGFPINNALPNSVCSLGSDDHTLVIINHFARDGSMYKGFSFMEGKADGSFSFPDPIYINDFHSKSTDVNLCMSKDGDVIILSLNRSEGLGDNDLYVSFKLKRNLWSEPINLGPQVNSNHRELTPFISEDKTKLYFSSNRPGGIGGMDIYVANRLDYSWKEWSAPELLPEPINSTSDDSNPAVVEPNALMYFISRRDGTSDIFKTELLSENLIINQPITLRGTVRHSITNEVLSSELFYGINRLSIQNHDVQSLPNGVFEIKLNRPDVYKISPRKAGYIGKNQLVDVNMLIQSNILIYEIDFYLTPLDIDQKIEIGNVYFEKGKPIVLAQSFPEIDRLADMLIQNSSISIRIDGHTDNVGLFDELLDLSRSRAEAIKKYLVLQKGIGSHRIGTVGYGGSRPISPNDSEENRSKNRRVEIYVTTSSNTQRKVNVNDLKDPLIKPVTDGIEATEPPGIQSNQLNSISMNSVEKQTEAPQVPKLKQYGNIQFNINELSVKETSMLELRKLIEYLMSNPDIKIILQGMCTDREVAPNLDIKALQRAKGIKEYLIFKSIKADRITIQENNTEKTFPGVKVFTLN
ncbi:MAG: OmpA family protein [Saprospiraceae bacterium]